MKVARRISSLAAFLISVDISKSAVKEKELVESDNITVFLSIIRRLDDIFRTGVIWARIT
jgi:hypothetical protein